MRAKRIKKCRKGQAEDEGQKQAQRKIKKSRSVPPAERGGDKTPRAEEGKKVKLPKGRGQFRGQKDNKQHPEEGNKGKVASAEYN